MQQKPSEPKKDLILSGIQPTGELHLGNYLGALKNWVALQAKYPGQCLFFIADYHSLTEDYDPKLKQRQVWDLAADLLAIGLDPAKSTLFIQSHVPEHLELAWIFNCLTSVAQLERMTQYKDKAARQTANVNAGLFDYPVLMAADILIYRPAAVPVGDDQDQHLEITNDTVKAFNHRFGQFFSEIKGLHTPTPRIMSLLQPDKKMSKSLGDQHCLNLFESPEQTAKKLSRAMTDTKPVAGQPMTPGTTNLFLLLEQFADKSAVGKFKQAHADGTIRYSELKQTLADAINQALAPIRERRAMLGEDIDSVRQVFLDGSEKAREMAQRTMEQVRRLVGLR